MNVLSLFDGKACGKTALKRAGIPVNKYFASEIDKPAIKVAMKNNPDIIQIGDVEQVTKKLFKNDPIDLLIGGSPCQGFSFSGKQLNFDDPRSKLVFEYVRLLKSLKPKYFLLENVNMKKEFQDAISELLGVQPVSIVSSCVSAQSRLRLYWTNIKFDKSFMENTGPLMTDILDDDETEAANYSWFKVEDFREFTNLGGLASFIKKNNLKDEKFVFNYSTSGRGNGVVEARTNLSEKALTLTKSGYSSRAFTGVYYPHGEVRSLSINEMERLQNLETDYTKCEGVSNSQRKQMIGNGWTVDVIANILKGIQL